MDDTLCTLVKGSEGSSRLWPQVAASTASEDGSVTTAGDNESSETACGCENTADAEAVQLALPVFTTEYDVVACEDFIEDQGRWVRFMPDEIRDANPGFIPS